MNDDKDMPKSPKGLKASVGLYDAMAPDYDRLTTENSYSLAEEVFAAVVGNDSRPGLTILDIGIGTGLCSEGLAAKGHAVTGIDGSAEMLKACNDKGFAKELIHATIDGGHVPVEGQTFDIVICVGVYEFIAEADQFLADIARILNPRGLLVLAVRDPELNPQFTAVEHNGCMIDAGVLANPGVLLFHHTWTRTKAALETLGFGILEAKEVLAYTSPSQNAAIMNRLAICKRGDD